MFARLLLLFIIVPMIELFLLIEVGERIGTLSTLALIMFTGALGAFLAKRQGMLVLQRLRMQIQGGQLPTDALFDGAMILIAGAFLMTPGILTDVLGFSLLIPATRRMLRQVVSQRIQRAIQDGRIVMMGDFRDGFSSRRASNRPDEQVIIVDGDE